MSRFDFDTSERAVVFLTRTEIAVLGALRELVEEQYPPVSLCLLQIIMRWEDSVDRSILEKHKHEAE